MVIKRKTWEERFIELEKFKEFYGHCSVSTKQKNNIHSSLGNWVSMQRRYYKFKNKLLTAEQITKLNGIGFKWSVKINWANRNATNKELLKELKKISYLLGRPPKVCEVNENGNYNYIVYLKRFGGLKNAMTKTGLDSFGEDKWKKRVRELDGFIKKHGRTPFVSEKKHAEVAKWCVTQRYLYRKGNLSKVRVKQLRQIKFLH
jgi:hypothetical protein